MPEARMTELDVPSEVSVDHPDLTVDNRGKGCASGIVEVQRALEDLSDGALLEIRSTDRRATVEYPQLAEQTPHELLGIEETRTGLLRKEYTTHLRIHHERTHD